MIFGIDFGTTHTVVSWVENDVAKLFEWNLEKKYLKNTEINGMKNIKRLMSENSDNIYNMIISKNTSLIFENTIEFFKEIHSQLNEQFPGEEIKQCILTIPARFDDIARNAIKSAAISAGFNVIKLLAEPVAAAITQIKNKKNGYYLVYDLGGGTFDVSLLNFQNGVFQILAIDGFKDFGGIDIDKFFAEQYKVSEEEAKILKEEGNFSEEIKQKLKELLAPTFELIHKLLEENKIKKEEIIELILAGGSSRLKIIQETLKEDFLTEAPDRPEYSIALGAAIHAYSIVHDENHLLIDITPFSLSLETINDSVEVIIPKNSPIPYAKTEYFKASGEANILINILQGNKEKASECTSLGKFSIPYEEKIAITFMLDCDGILSLKIKDKVFLVSLNQKIKNKNGDLENQYNLLKERKNLSEVQKKCLLYLEQAKEIELSPEAETWLKNEIEKAFGKNV